MPQDLAKFSNQDFDRGGSKFKEICWLVIRKHFFESSVLPWYRTRRFLLRSFGGRIGEHIIVKPGVKITFPWKLTVGANSWLGEDAWLLNLAEIVIGDNVCISQRAFICTGSHDWRDPAFKLITKPVTVEDGVWVCADVFVAPGVRIGKDSVVTTGSVVTRDLPANMICSGNPCKPVKPRVFVGQNSRGSVDISPDAAVNIGY